MNDNINRSSGLELPVEIIREATVPIGPKVTARTVKLPEFAIVEDTREQNPLTSEFETVMNAGDTPPFSIVRETLHTGDYSVRGLESSICFERKSISDLVGTLNPKTGNYEPNWSKTWQRFNREIMRMRFFDRRMILCEGTLHDILSHRYQAQIAPASITGMLKAIEVEHGVRTVFCGCRVAMARFIVRECADYFFLRFKKYFRPEDFTRENKTDITDI